MKFFLTFATNRLTEKNSVFYSPKDYKTRICGPYQFEYLVFR
jgi:hypothetical protein